MHVLRYTVNRLIAVKTYRLEKSISIILSGVLYALMFSIFTGLMSRVKFYTPFTPVPFTGQVFAVLLSGLLLGRIFGPLSQIFYIALGLSGIPWFAIGPFSITGGYIVGFVVASFLVGLLTDNIKRLNIFISALAMIAGLSAIYTLGLIQFCLYTGKSIADGVKLAILPFIPFDLLKIIIVLGAGQIIFKKRTRYK